MAVYFEILDLVHTNICDLMVITTRDQKKHFNAFIGDGSGYYYMYLLETKDAALSKFVIFENEV